MSGQKNSPPDFLDGSAPAMSGLDPSPSPASSAHEASAFELSEADRYERGHVLGVGGMGRVVQAFDRRLGREVALKEVSAAAARDELTARLIREARITSRLEHPGIVSVHDAGTLEGHAFYTMRIVRGRSLAAALADAHTAPARLRLMRHILDACEAVGWAHRHGVVHRDLKPANIMVGEFGETQVVDWGLAAEVDVADTDRSTGPSADEPTLTRVGAVIGTPRYMSPEQARGESATPRSDVWSLGCVLFEVATGEAAVGGVGSDEVLAKVARGDIVQLDRLHTIAPELRAIIKRALDPLASRRYADAKALAVDLGDWLDGRRVAAHEYSTWELFVRLARAWRKQLIVAGAALVALAVFIAFAFAEITAERERALSAERDALSAADTARLAEDRALTARSRSDRALAAALVGEAVDRANADGRAEAELLAAHALALDDSPLAWGVLASTAAAAPPELRVRLPMPNDCAEPSLARDGMMLVCRDTGRLRAFGLAPPLSPISRPIPRWTVAHDGRGAAVATRANLVATGDIMQAMALFAADTGARLPVPALTCCGLAPSASEDGETVWVHGSSKLVAVRHGRAHELDPCESREETAGTVDTSGTRWAMSCRDGTVWHGPIGEPPRAVATGVGLAIGQDASETGHAPAAALAFTRDGEHLLMASTRGLVALIELATGRVLATWSSGLAMPRRLATSPDGRFLAILGERHAVRVLDLQARQWRSSLLLLDVRAMLFLEGQAADLVTLGDELRVWRLPTATQSPRTPRTPWTLSRIELADGVTSIASHGDLLAITRGKGLTVTALDGHRLYDGSWFDGIVKGGAFSAGGDHYVATSGVSRRTTRFDTETWSPIDLAPTDVALREVAILTPPGGLPEVTYHLPHRLGLEVSPGDDPTLSPLPDVAASPLTDLARSPGGRFLIALAPLSGEVLRVDAATPLIAETRPLTRDAVAVALGDDGDTVLAAEVGGVTEWRPEGLVRRYDAERVQVIAVALSPSGRWVAAGARDGTLRVWERPDGALRFLWRDHVQRVSAVTFVSDDLLASGSWDWTVRLRDLSVLDTPRAAWVPRIETRWGLTLDDVLSDGSQPP